MTDDRLEQAMNSLLDGTATPEESAWIRPLIAGNAELRHRFEELEEAHRLLGRAPRLEAPADLKPAILRAIETPAPATTGESWLATLGRVFRQRQSVGYAYAFAGGLAVALLGLALLGRLSPPPQWQNLGQQSGTMVAPSDQAGPEPVGRTTIEAGGARIIAEALAADGTVELHLGIEAAGPVEFEVRTDAGILPLAAFEQSPNPEATIDLQAGRAHWAGLGSQEVVLQLKRLSPGGVPLTIQLSSGGETAAGSIDVGPLVRR